MSERVPDSSGLLSAKMPLMCFGNTYVKILFLAYPDLSKPFILYCDASDLAIGAVLSRMHAGVERIVYCASHTLNKALRNYTTSERECLAIVWGCSSFRHYLMNNAFTIRTDHSALQWLHSMKDPHGRIGRWVLALQQFSYDVVHRPGTKHA
jgi:hypothetical protein